MTSKFSVVSWNVNSVRKREPLILEFLKEHNPDILCMQEIKCQNEQFIYDSFLDAGYNSYVHGQKSYNGVAILTKQISELTCIKLENYDYEEARMMKVQCGDLCIYNVYVTNGQMHGSPAYYKQINFLESLHADIIKTLENTKKIVVCGDFNVAPLDEHADFALRSSFICDPYLRQLWFKMLEHHLIDVMPNQYTWWDYRFKTQGARIDSILGSKALRATDSCILDKYRFGVESPSDHTPIMTTFYSV